MAMDVGGRLIIEDAFSQTFVDFEKQAERADATAEKLGQTLDTAVQAPTSEADEYEAYTKRLDEMLAKQAEAAQETQKWMEEFSTQDARGQIQMMEDQLDQFRAKIKSGDFTLDEMQEFQQAEKDLERLKQGLAEVTGTNEKANASFKDTVAAIAGFSIGGFAVKQLIDMGVELTRVGAAAIDVEKGFEALARSRGGDADQLIGGLQEASKGAVDSSQLMLAANRAMIAGGEELAGKLPALYNVARASAMTTGSDAASSFEGIVRGIANLSERALRTQGIIVDLDAANKAWAEANGRVVESLTDEERRMIAANAVIEDATPLIRELGLESATASEKMQSLPVAIGNVKTELGKLIAEKGGVDLLAGLAKILSQGTQENAVRRDLEDVKAELISLGQVDLLKSLQDDFAELNKQNLKGIVDAGLSLEKQLANAAQFDAGISDLVERYRDLSNERRLAENPELFKAEAANTREAAAATSTWADALQEAQNRLTGLQTLEGQFAQAVVSGNAALSSMPEMPEISIGMDVEALRAWGDAWLAVNPALAEARAELERTAVALEQNQQQLFGQAAGITDMDDRLEFLRTGLLGTGASVGDLIAAISNLPPELLAAIGPTDELVTALVRLQTQAAQDYTIDVQIRQMGAVLNDIETLSLRVAEIYGPEKARAFYDAAVRENEQFWQGIDANDTLGAKMASQAFTGYLTDMVNAADPAFQKIKKAGTDAFDGIAKSAGELKSKIESALNEGLQVTAADFMETAAGTYEDAPLEAARRLDAIAARGFAELKAHPDWAGLLEIPADVLAGSEDQLKAWAANTSEAVKNLERPDLIDWDAFIANFQHQLDQDAAKELTIDIAVEKLTAAGLLSGSKEERRKKVAEALGIEAPELTIDALFKAQEGAGADLANQVSPITVETMLKLAEGAAEEVQAKLDGLKVTAATPEMSAAEDRMSAMEDKLNQGLENLEPSKADVSQIVDVPAAQEQLKAAGAQAMGYVASGAEESLITTNISTSVAAAWSTDFSGNIDVFKSIGTSLGRTVGDAFLTAMEEGVGNVRRRIAELVAPEVAAILSRQKTSGAMP